MPCSRVRASLRPLASRALRLVPRLAESLHVGCPRGLSGALLAVVLSHGAVEQFEVLVDGDSTLGFRDRCQVFEGGAEASRDLRLPHARDANLLEGKPDIVVPVADR